MKTVLIIGSGGREHALGWKLAQSPHVGRIILAPGNSGMPSSWERWPVNLSEGNPAFKSLARRAREQQVDLAVIGPDNPLADGIVDIFDDLGVLCFGPRAGAAQIEASKAFAKDVMQAAQVPTAHYWVASSEPQAREILKSLPWKSPGGWVVKADGLALGKGVRVCESLAEGLEALSESSRFSQKWVIEERLFGEELSWMAFCDGETCSLLEPARDYKRLKDGDLGPNTGGMGAFSPVPGVSDTLGERVRNQVFLPTLRELKKRGTEFRGLLYAGLMVDSATDRYWVLEFNCRFGDPETQVLLPRMNDDLYVWCEATALGSLKQMPKHVQFISDAAVFVVAAASGYPEQPLHGARLQGESHLGWDSQNARYFSAGVQEKEGSFFVAGGRVFGALGLGQTMEGARETAYRHLGRIHFEGMQFRSDIGKRKSI